MVRDVDNINAYLAPGPNVFVEKASAPLNRLPRMNFGNKPVDGGHLLLTAEDVEQLGLSADQRAHFIRKNYGGAEFIRGIERYCLWIEDEHVDEALGIPAIAERVEAVRSMRLASPDKGANAMAARSHQMREMLIGTHHTIVAAAISSENRPYLPCGIIDDL